MIQKTLRGISDVAYMKIILHLPFVIFSFGHKIFYIASNLILVNRAFLTDHICFDIVSSTDKCNRDETLLGRCEA